LFKQIMQQLSGTILS